MSERRTIEVGALARVEGEGVLHLTVEQGAVTDLRLEIYEPPRLFESLAVGREAVELPDLLARICGICPVAYQMSAVHALEQAWGVEADPATRALRRLYYAGEWIESHLLHMVFLSAPDRFGVDDVAGVAVLAPTEVRQAIELRKLGNRILELLGGRSVNPVGVRIGGFHRIPRAEERHDLAADLGHARADMEALARWYGRLPCEPRPADFPLVALVPENEYPMNEGPIGVSDGTRIAASSFEQHFEEHQVRHSTALHSRLRGSDRTYQVGPLARVWLNRDRLSPTAAGLLEEFGDRFVEPDPASTGIARAIEVVQAFDEALAALKTLETLESRPAEAPTPRAGVGHAATEAPRGLLYVRVETDETGHVRALRIVPPTSQNQARIEEDLRSLSPRILEHSDGDGRRLCEAAIRDYDPCISCATHFLKLEIHDRSERG